MSREVAVNGARLVVEERGSGSPLVLVHGLGGTATGIWKHQLDAFADDFHVVAYDLRGSGRSEVTAGPYTIEGLADDLAGVVEALDLGPVALMGHSMGGSIVLDFAARHPDAVRALVGLGAPATFPEQARQGLAARAETVEASGMDAVAETVATNGVAPSFRERAPDEFRAFVGLLAASDPQGYAAQCRALVGLELVDSLPRITAPVLLVSGDRDGVCPPAAAAANAAAVRDGRAVTVEDAAHILTWERPNEVAAAVRPFLAAAR